MIAPSLGHRAYDPLKRLIDIVVAFGVLAALSPLWLAIALAIKLTSRGPVLYSNTVVGKDGKPFRYYKFRSMYVNNDDSRHRAFIKDYVQSDKPFTVADDHGKRVAVYKVINDPRVTRVGHWLRAYSLDEVPQFINVLRGEMSVVGPRPPLQFEYELYDERAKQRLAVKPGITGLAQVEKRGTASFSEMIGLDLHYIAHRSLPLDARIMIKTVGVMLGRKGYTG